MEEEGIYPMIQVAGPDGTPTYVYRPWTMNELKESLSHLPPITGGGEAFTAELTHWFHDFTPTVAEAKRALMTVMRPSEFTKIRQHFIDAVTMPSSPGWMNDAASDYNIWTLRVLDAIKRQFPKLACLENLERCKQRDNEPTEDFITRLCEIFEKNCGIEKPDQELGSGDLTVYEAHLCQHLMQKLLPDIAAAIKISCVGWNRARFPEILRHAVHAEETMTESKKKRKEKSEKDLHHASLRLFQAAGQPQRTERGGHVRRGRGFYSRPQLNARDQSRAREGTCFNCGGKGHWYRDCPHPPASQPDRYQGGRGSQNKGRGRFYGRAEYQNQPGHFKSD